MLDIQRHSFIRAIAIGKMCINEEDVKEKEGPIEMALISGRDGLVVLGSELGTQKGGFSSVAAFQEHRAQAKLTWSKSPDIYKWIPLKKFFYRKLVTLMI